MTEFTQAKEGGYIDIRTRKGIFMKKKKQETKQETGTSRKSNCKK